MAPKLRTASLNVLQVILLVIGALSVANLMVQHRAIQLNSSKRGSAENSRKSTPIAPSDQASPSEPNQSRTKDDSAAPAFVKPKATIGYAVSLTGCGQDARAPDSAIGLVTQGAAVLKHSIHLAHATSKYDFRMYAFVHPAAIACSEAVSKLGYEVSVKPTPFNATEIKKQFLREHIIKSGCCGDKEYIKLYAYLLFDHPVVVHLDLDSLVLHPFDDLFDAMIDGPESPARSKIPVMFGEAMPQKIEAFFTRDYNMMSPGSKNVVGIQGGFLVVRPSQEAFDEYIDIVLEGNFLESGGWDGKYGWLFGGQQIQGICSYFWDARHPGTAVELNRCIYNSMVDAPKAKTKKGEEVCLDRREECEDCRLTDVALVKSAHFTLCNKPWLCHSTYHDSGKKQLCQDLHREWFRIRKDFEKSRALGVAQQEVTDKEGKYKPEIFFGDCKSEGQHGYIPLKV